MNTIANAVFNYISEHVRVSEWTAHGRRSTGVTSRVVALYCTLIAISVTYTDAARRTRAAKKSNMWSRIGAERKYVLCHLSQTW